MVNRQKQEERFIEWVKARDDDWWEDQARISIWDFRVMQEFFLEELKTIEERAREEERRFITCDCICHFNPKSMTDTAEGKAMGCGTCDFTGNRMNRWGYRTPAVWETDYGVTGKCLMSHKDIDTLNTKK